MKKPPSELNASNDDAKHPDDIDHCRRCELWRDATQGVPGKGPPRARIMLVGEQPGNDEDLAGLPFVGPAGKLLDRALAEAGVERDDVYITNAVKHFKFEMRGKRRLHKTPSQREFQACRYWLEQEIDSVNPKVVVTLGASALKAVLQDASLALGSMLNEVLAWQGRSLIPTYHPSFALRVPDADERERIFSAMVEALRQAKRLARR